jgi:hypothetical protein
MAAGARGIDHLVLSVGDLAAAGDFFARAGFTLTPRAEHPFGTANRLAIMDGNFLELLATSAPALIPPHRPGHYSVPAQHQSLLARRQGPSFLVLESVDARADHARFLAAGLPASAPLDFQRLAGQPDGTQATMSFSLVIVADPGMADAPHFVCQQHTPEHFWHAAYQSHANGARRISEAVLVADDPGALAPYYAGLVAPDAVHLDGAALAVETARGCVLVLPPSGLGPRFAGIEVPVAAPRPYIAGLQVTVGDLERAASCLAAGGIAFARADGRLRVAPAVAFGAALEFVAG